MVPLECVVKLETRVDETTSASTEVTDAWKVVTRPDSALDHGRPPSYQIDKLMLPSRNKQLRPANIAETHHLFPLPRALDKPQALSNHKSEVVVMRLQSVVFALSVFSAFGLALPVYGASSQDNDCSGHYY